MIGWHVVVGADANIEGLTGVVVQKENMGGGVERVTAVVLVLQLVIGSRRAFKTNFMRNSVFAQPLYSLALLWEREPPNAAPIRGHMRISRRLRLFWSVVPAREDRSTRAVAP